MIAAAYVGTATPVLTDSQINDIFIRLDTQFNQVMIHAFTHGIYTGVVTVTLWAVGLSTRKSPDSPQNHRRQYFLESIILLLYLLGTFGFCYEWITNASIYITNGKVFWMVYESSISLTPSLILVLTAGIDATLSTILANITLIRRCWTIWGQSWLIVLVPILCTVMATALSNPNTVNLVSGGIVTYYSTFGPIDKVPPQALYLKKIVNWAVLYSSLILATLLCCTILIIYWMHAYDRVVEVLVESASLYSAIIAVLLVFEVRNEGAGTYIEEFAVAMRGILPTILVGRIAAGYARPDNSWDESGTSTSLRFRGHSSSQNDTQVGAGSEWDTSSQCRNFSRIGRCPPNW
ncbi:hypothetical protein EDD85DRAFT_941538 [Armillaria nabsnona]|nr:hypothetical protein EDD85DRAFT_941538 [Armillaria nabsnona]